MNIGILGIGGVGGFFGGKLAAQYRNSPEVTITFVSRAASVAAIRARGLELRIAGTRQIIHPYKTVSDTKGLPPFDVLICATKSYDLEAALAPLQDCISAETLILPLLNGVNAGETIRKLYPEALIAGGCVYINAQRVAPGVIEKNGIPEKLYFGGKRVPGGRLHSLQDAAHRATLEALVREAYAVALANRIGLPAGLAGQTMTRLEGFPFDATSSMHRDFKAGAPTEYRSLTKFVSDTGAALGVATPAFDSMLRELAARDGASVS